MLHTAASASRGWCHQLCSHHRLLVRPLVQHLAAMAAPNPPSSSATAGAQSQPQARLLYTERVLDSSQQDTGVRVLHLNNPESLNSLTTNMAAEFTKELQQLRADSTMRALIVTGRGRAFSAGGDFSFIEERMAASVQDNQQVLGSFYCTFLALRSLPVVTIAAINGPAVGGGLGFALACDMRLASTNAKLSANFVKLGITPGMGSTCMLPAATNHQVACRLLLTGDLITAQEAKELGLVLEVHPPDQLLAAAQALAGRVAAAAPAAVSATLQMLRLQLPQHVLQEAALLEAREQAVFFKAEDIKEGLAAVKEKRQPCFQSTAAMDATLAAPGSQHGGSNTQGS
ncbi:ClpP/crotonase-like domain-containing protein [Scenedesmus sp. NREL 46B-D3]|nr:ClpP/crotonase-like domain-containing protein [Scenedesmus sp. NREL 46B-D3]